MQTITKKQYDSLVKFIYLKLMENPDFGLGEMNDCKEQAEITVNEWIKENSIVLED